MTWSANEVTVLCAKAARGAGAPPAQAAMFGQAAHVHLAAGHGCGALQEALAALPHGPICDYPLRIAALAETAHDGVAEGALKGLSSDAFLQSYLATQPYRSERLQGDRVRLYLTEPAPHRVVARLAVPETCAARMQAMAATLLVPETEASRLGGAGAGLTDND